MDKIIELKTLKDVLEAINPENVDFFLRDFNDWLKIMIAVKEKNKEINGLIQDGSGNNFEVMRWIDDKKNNKNINVKII